jgi:hypothetical protein
LIVLVSKEDPHFLTIKKLKNESIVVIVVLCVVNFLVRLKNIHLRLLKLEKENNQLYLFLVCRDVWNETKSNFENDFTCYTLTAAHEKRNKDTGQLS